MARLVRKMIFGLRTQGPSYLYHAPWNEIVHPRLPVTRVLRKTLVSAVDLFGKAVARDERPLAGDALCFIYDLSVAPITFDFISYLAAAELSRRRNGLRYIDVAFVPDKSFGMRPEQPDYEVAVDLDERIWRLRNILIPALNLLPSVRSYGYLSRDQAEQFAQRSAARIYPEDYRFYLPCQPVKSVVLERVRDGEALWPMLQASNAAKRYIAQFFDRYVGDRRPVAISLRNYGFAPARNSRIAEWKRFAERLDPSRYVPVFVPDTEMAMTVDQRDFAGHPVCLAACWNIQIRMALYEAAWLNVGLMHGPLELCWFSQTARYLIFIASGSDRMNAPDALTEHGYRIGADLDFATPYQHIVWQPDELKNIEAEFEAFAPRLAAASA